MDSKSAIISSCDLIMSPLQAILEYMSILTYLFPFSYIHTYICNWIQVEGKADFKYLAKFLFSVMSSLEEISYLIFTLVGDQKEDLDMVLREWELTEKSCAIMRFSTSLSELVSMHCIVANLARFLIW